MTRAAQTTRSRLVAESLRVGNPVTTARTLPEEADPRLECQIDLPVDQIREYEHNPRRIGNAKFAEIKESIRAVGLRNPLTVTRRPGEVHFIVEAGGNTRLLAIQQLWAETHDARFETLSVLFRPWRSESHVLAAHLIENEQRGALTYWDRASGVMALRRQLETEQGRTLSLSELENELRVEGYPVSKAALGFYAFAVHRLGSLGAALPWLTSEVVKRLQQGFNRLKRYAEVCHDIAEADLYTEVIDPVLVETAMSSPAPGILDADGICDRCAGALAHYLCRPAADIREALGGAASGVVPPADTAREERCIGAAGSDLPSRSAMTARTAELVRRFAALSGIEPLVVWDSAAPHGFCLRTPESSAGSAVAPELGNEHSRRAWRVLRCLADQPLGSVRSEPDREEATERALVAWLLDREDAAAGVFVDLLDAIRRDGPESLSPSTSTPQAMDTVPQ